MSAARILFIFLGSFSAVATLLSDFNRLHIFNPNWPPHARFHAAAYAILNILGSLLAAFLALKEPFGNASLYFAASLLFLSVFTFFLALAVPGTSPVASSAERHMWNIPVSVCMAGVFALLVALGSWGLTR